MLGLIDQKEWQMLFKAAQTRSLQGDSDYNRLLRSLFLYEYRDERGRWVDLNPVLAETEIFRQWQYNQASLTELQTGLRREAGEFSLTLALCNYHRCAIP
jgi:hypothetical protein